MNADTHTTVPVTRETYQRLQDARLHESMSLEEVINMALSQADLDEDQL